MIPRGQPGRRSADLKLWAWVALGRLVPALGPESRGQPVCRLGPVRGAASLCSWCAPTRGFRCGRPSRVSGVGGQLGFQLWVPSLLIWVCATSLHVRAGSAYPAFTVQGLRGDGCQRLRLLRRVL